MLIRLAVENFYSIRDKQIFDLRLPRTTPVDPARFREVRAGVRVPSVVAVFGANASGKSTLLRAIGFVERFTTRSFEMIRVGEPIPIQPFACEGCKNKPSSIELEFSADSLWYDDEPAIYRYELQVQQTNQTGFVAWEALRRSVASKKFRTLFERTGKEDGTTVVRPFEDLEIAQSDPRLSVRPNVSVISSLVQFAHPVAEAIRRDFAYIITNSVDRRGAYESSATEHYGRKPENLKRLNEYIKRVDLGIERVFLDQRDGKAVAMFEHTGLDDPQMLESESQGTRNFYGLFPLLSMALSLGGMAVIDEIDSDLHPLIMPEIIRWFRDDKINQESAQLIMTCHNATLLDELSKDEVFFTDKTRKGVTQVYSLRDISGVRRDTNIYAKYLSGSFGAVPQIG